MRYLKRCKRKFTRHPESVGETYFEHFAYASGVAAKTAKISVIIALHAIFPFTCETTASDMIKEINKEMQKRKEDCKDE
jgi:hypothetical protein